MERGKTSFRDALRDFAQEERRALGEHPSIPELAAYRGRSLPEAEQERIADHLALCQECRTLVLELGELEDSLPGEGEEAEGEPQTRVAWGALRARMLAEVRADRGPIAGMSPMHRFEAEPLRQEAGPTAGSEAPSPVGAGRHGEGEPGVQGADARRSSRRLGNRASLAMAASLVLAVGGVYFGWQQWNKRFEPRTGMSFVYLDPHEERSRGTEMPQVPEGSDYFVLVIIPPGDSKLSAYNVRILQDERVLYARQLKVTLDETGAALKIELSRKQFPAGEYRVLLFPPGRGGQPVDNYSFQVLGPPRSGPHP